MTRSHGMSPGQYDLEIFKLELNAILDGEKQAYLKSIFEDFLNRFEYRGSKPLDESDIKRASFAASVFAQLQINTAEQLTSQERYLLQKFFEALTEVALKLDVEIEVSNFKDLIDGNPAGVEPRLKVENRPTSMPVKPQFQKIDLGDFTVELKRDQRNGGKTRIVLFQDLPGDSEYIRSLKQLAKAFFSNGNFGSIGRTIQHIQNEFVTMERNLEEINADIEQVLGEGLNHLAEILSNPRLNAKDSTPTYITRKKAIDHVVNAFRNLEKSPIDVSRAFVKGSAAYGYFGSRDFLYVAMDQMRTLLRRPDDSNLPIVWNVRKIGVEVDNNELQALAAFTYAFYHSTYESHVKVKQKMFDKLGPDIEAELPDDILSQFAYGEHTWGDIVRSAANSIRSGFDNPRCLTD